ncbi:MAG: hypothetical protein J2P17_16975, partial [Mycobacterium sp.]|nr:hypothetical protein [Mycobacterium sp.]
MNSKRGVNKGISRRVVLQGSVAAGLAAALPVRSAAAASADVSAVVDVAKTGDPISKNIYGGLLEQLGSLVYASLWSEVLFDRKFFNAVEEQAQPAQKWIPLGPADAV